MLREVLAVLLTVSIAAPTYAQQPLSIEIQQAPGAQARALDPIEFTLIISLPSRAGDIEPEPPAKPVSDSADGSAALKPAGYRMFIASVQANAGGALKVDYADKAECSFQEQGMHDGQSIAVPCILYPKDDKIASRLVPGLSAIFARTAILHAEVNYRQSDKTYTASFATRIAIIPPIVAVFYGGMVGALLLALFRALAPFHGALLTMAGRAQFSRRELLQSLYQKASLVFRVLLITFAWVVLGGVCAIMIIILTKASTGELSPIKVEINDFIGGVLVGLLSFPVVSWLQKRLMSFDT